MLSALRAWWKRRQMWRKRTCWTWPRKRLSEYTARPDERVSVNRFPKWQK